MFGFRIFSNVIQWVKRLNAGDDLDNIIDIIDVRTTYKKDKGFFDTTLPTFKIIKIFHIKSGNISDVVKRENYYITDENFLLSKGFIIRHAQFDERKPQIKYSWIRLPWEIENRVDIIDVYQQAHIGTATGELVVKHVIEYTEVNSPYQVRKKEIFGAERSNKKVLDYLSGQKMFIRNYLPKHTEFAMPPRIEFDRNTSRGSIIYDSRYPRKS